MNTLFELRTEEEMRTAAIAENTNRVHEAMMGRGPWELSERQRSILEQVRGRQGRRLAIPIAEIAARTGVDARSVKAEIRELVINFRLPIVASRDGDAGGYYFAVTAEERISGTADYVKEIVALAERVRIIRNLPDLATLWGQISLNPETGKAQQ